MKTILRIITILLVASAVAGVFSLAVNNSSTTSGADESGELSAMTNAQPMERPAGGDHEGGSLTQGLSGVLTTSLKLAGITFLVLLLQKAFNQPGSLKWKFAQH